jgi:hypothetical protein
MAMKNPEVHALTTDEILRQIKAHSARRAEIVAQRAALYRHAQQSGISHEAPIADADERAAREHAKSLLNGSSPAWLSLPPDVSQDRILYREQRALDIVLKILNDKNLVALANAGVEWEEQHGDRYRELVRRRVLLMVEADACGRAAEQMLGSCPDIFATKLPRPDLYESGTFSETEALAAGVVTQSDIRKAKNVE